MTDLCTDVNLRLFIAGMIGYWAGSICGVGAFAWFLYYRKKWRLGP